MGNNDNRTALVTGAAGFIGYHISNTPLSVADERDVKGLYAKAHSGQLRNFTRIDSPYEAPETHIDTTAMSIDDAAKLIAAFLILQ